MGLEARSAAAGFAGALVVLAALVWFVGVDALLTALSGADPTLLAVVLLVAALWLTAWALALRAVLGALGATISPLRAVAIYAGVLFANNVTPFGQAGGEPASALLISGTARTEYETALAAIASADSLNFLPSTGLALVGVTYFSVVVAVGEEIRWATAAVVGMAVAIPVAGYLGWRNRNRLEAAVGRVLTPLTQVVTRRVPWFEEPTRGAVEERIGGFFEAIEVVAEDRRALAVAVGFSTLGWLAQATALWISLQAVGVAAPFAAVLVAVPVGAIAGVTPLPGGLGGVEAVLIALLVPLAAVAPATAAAAVVIHRGAIYWLPTLVGGGVVSAVGARRV